LNQFSKYKRFTEGATRKICLLLIILLNSMHVFGEKLKPLKNFVIYYGADEDAKAFTAFDLVVLESSYTKIVKDLKKENKIVLAYLSIGEVNSSRSYFHYLKSKQLLLENNPNWPEAFLIDIRNPEWGSYIVETLIPSILGNGFDGIFIDTLDSPIEKERVNPEKFDGMKKAAIDIIEKARRAHPGMKIMLNRAYEIAPDVASSIDYILGESICNTYDFSKKKYLPVDDKLYMEQVKILNDIKGRNPLLQAMTLDYCDEKDQSRRQEIYKKEKKNGFIPYVTTIDLGRVSKPDRK
jgi:uncharacterized protein (TIGR01370 family)